MPSAEAAAYQRDRTLFYSGWGTGSADEAVYMQYESQLRFTPTKSMHVTAIKPRIHTCSGECVYVVWINDSVNRELAHLKEREASYSRFDGRLPRPITFVAGKNYTITTRVHSNRDGIGIYTTGGAPFPNSRGNGKMELVYAQTGLKKVDHRGAISFSLLGQYVEMQVKRKRNRSAFLLEKRKQRQLRRLQRKSIRM